jgi:hypothetical protein
VALTVGLLAVCRDLDGVWGRPLPYATPFLVTRDGQEWTVAA